MKKCPKVSDYISAWSGIDLNLEVMKSSESWFKPAPMPNPKVIEVVEYEDYYSNNGAPFRKITPKEAWDDLLQREDPVVVAWAKRVKLIRKFKIVRI